MRVTKCVCGCGNFSFDHAGWYHVPQLDRGKRVAYMCPVCATKEGGEDVTKGKLCGGGVSYRVVFPTTHTSAAAQAYALKNDWRREGAGYVSPTWRNLHSPKKQFLTWELMRNEGKFDLANNQAPLIVAPWGGLYPEECAAIDAARGELFGGARVSITPEGVMLDARFIDAAQFMDAMKQAKAMMLALLKWLDKPTAKRAEKVRKFFTAALPA